MTSWLTQNQSAVMAILTLAYVVATAVMVIAMLRSNRLSRASLDASDRAEKRRSRPYVFFDIEVRDGWVFAVLRNTGASPALDVHVSLNPALTHNAGSSRRETGLTKHAHGFLAPGRLIEDFIDSGPNFFGAYPDTRVFSGAVKYQDVEGNSYSEPVTVDLKVQEDLFYTSHPDLGKELAKIAKAAEELVRRVGQQQK